MDVKAVADSGKSTMTQPVIDPAVIEAERLRFGIVQGRRSSVGAYISAPLIALFLTKDLVSFIPLAWAVLVVLTLWVRNILLHRHEQQFDSIPLEQSFNLFSYSSQALGLALGSLPAWIMPLLPQTHALLLTAVLCVWVAVAMASLGVLPRVFRAYALIIAIGITIGWVRTANEYSAIVLILAYVYMFVLVSFANNFAHSVEEGIRIRFTNQELVRELSLANEAKSRFILAASHDLRQPLQALVLFSHALADCKDPQEQQTIVTGIQQSIKSLGQLFSAVLDLSKIDAKVVTPVVQALYLPELLSRLSREYAYLCREKGLDWKVTPLPVTVKTDPTLFERILRNLIDNAIKHGAQGPIEVNVSLGDRLLITVSDHGPGIAPAEREHVFQEFYRLQSSSGGLGLGLSIVQRLVELLGMRLSIAYTDPQRTIGSQFRLEIPYDCLIREGAPAETFQHLGRPADTHLAGLSVLVIDDDPEVLQATLLLLRQWECQAMGIADPDALREIRQEILFQPDVALIDNSRTHASDALALADTVLARWPDAGVIVVTGESDPYKLERLRQSGHPLLSKPIHPEELRKVLELFRHLGN